MPVIVSSKVNSCLGSHSVRSAHNSSFYFFAVRFFAYCFFYYFYLGVKKTQRIQAVEQGI